MLNFEVRVLMGWLSHSIRYPANQNAFLKVKPFYYYVKVAYHFRPEYNAHEMLWSCEKTIDTSNNNNN